MMEEEKIQRINYLTTKLGIISLLAFKKDNLDEVLIELEKLIKICIYEEKIS